MIPNRKDVRAANSLMVFLWIKGFIPGNGFIFGGKKRQFYMDTLILCCCPGTDLKRLFQRANKILYSLDNEVLQLQRR